MGLFSRSEPAPPAPIAHSKLSAMLTVAWRTAWGAAKWAVLAPIGGAVVGGLGAAALVATAGTFMALIGFAVSASTIGGAAIAVGLGGATIAGIGTFLTGIPTIAGIGAAKNFIGGVRQVGRENNAYKDAAYDQMQKERAMELERMYALQALSKQGIRQNVGTHTGNYINADGQSVSKDRVV